MRVQCMSVNNNVSFDGLKLKNNKVKPNFNTKHPDPSNIENKLSLIGWGILFAGLLYGTISGAMNLINKPEKSDDEKYLLNDEQLKARQNDTAACDSACMALKNDIDQLGIDGYIEKWNSDNK